jgi:hypothetical protein
MSNNATLDSALEAKLKRMRLRVEAPDTDTLALKRVPANERCFNKARTNVLIKRTTEGMPCVVCVDEDLEYQGADPALAHAFAAGATQQGWRVLTFGGGLHGDLTSALEFTLGMLGSDEGPDSAPTAPVHAKRGLLTAWAANLSDAVAADPGGATLFREEEVEQAACCALSWEGRLPLIAGNSGTGKTNLLHGVARLLAGRKQQVLSVNMGAIMAGTLFESEREALLLALLREAHDSGATLSLEQAEWALIGLPRGPVLLREALDRGTRLIATAGADHEQRFAPHPLGSRLDVVRLKELCASDTRRVLEVLSPAIAAHHHVEIDAEVKHAAVERSLIMDGSLPGKAVKLLDLAAARASLTGSNKIMLLDVFVTASRMPGESV